MSGTPTNTNRRFCDQPTAAEYLGVSTKTVRRMIASGELTAYRLGRRLIRIDLAELEQLARPIPSARGISR